MKSNYYLLLAVLLLAFTSCEKDEDKIVGNWEATSLVNANCTDATENISLSFTDGCSNFGFGQICMDVSFSKNVTYVLTTKTSALGQVETETSNGSWEIVSDKLKLCSDDGDCENSPYTIDNNVLTFSSSDVDSGCKTTFKVKKN